MSTFAAGTCVETRGDLQAWCLTFTSNDSCASCGREIGREPGMLVYRPLDDHWDICCEDCALKVMRSALQIMLEEILQ